MGERVSEADDAAATGMQPQEEGAKTNAEDEEVIQRMEDMDSKLKVERVSEADDAAATGMQPQEEGAKTNAEDEATIEDTISYFYKDYPAPPILPKYKTFIIELLTNTHL